MVVTSLKTMPEIREGNIFGLPQALDFGAWARAWASACTGLNCAGISVGFWNSVKILVPSVAVSVSLAAWTGYALSFWRAKGAELIFGILLVGAFIPFQVFLYPLVRLFSLVEIYGTLLGIIVVHTVFGLPMLTLLFRNFFVGLPIDLFKAARVDGANFWQIFQRIMLPMATPVIAVAVILQVTGIWNDFLFGLVFAGSANQPMTVQLNNIVNSTFGETEHGGDDPYSAVAALCLFRLGPLVRPRHRGRRGQGVTE